MNPLPLRIIPMLLKIRQRPAAEHPLDEYSQVAYRPTRRATKGDAAPPASKGAARGEPVGLPVKKEQYLTELP